MMTMNLINHKNAPAMKDPETSAKNKGFTLVEFIVVVTLIGLLIGAMSLPILGIIENAHMRAERQ
jgi:prepilin-type N-terminal cleavage/methylation domain-containing protein